MRDKVRRQCPQTTTFGERERERQRERQTDRQTDRETEIERQRQRERNRDRQTDRQTERERQTDRQTDRQRAEADSNWGPLILLPSLTPYRWAKPAHRKSEGTTASSTCMQGHALSGLTAKKRRPKTRKKKALGASLNSHIKFSPITNMPRPVSANVDMGSIATRRSKGPQLFL